VATVPGLPARSPIPAAELYADLLGWPVAVLGDEVVVTCGDVLDITTMPSDLAKDVDRLLRMHRNQVPVMEVRDPAEQDSYWAFFSSPMHADGAHALAPLAAHKVDQFGAGAYIPLPPSPATARTVLRWLTPPSLNSGSAPLPSWATIAACVLRAIGRSGDG
jgi:hypothetical protein